MTSNAWTGRARLACLAACATAALSAMQAPRPPAVLFEGARLIDGSGRPPIESSAFVVSGDAFTAVGRKGEVRAPAGAVRVDLSGKVVMPGLIDAHTHPGYRKGLSFAAENYTRDTLTVTMQRLAYHGVVATLEMGTGRGDLPYRLRIEAPPGGALFRTAGRGFAMPDAGPAPPMRDAAYGVTTEAEARAYVQSLAARAVDVIKIWVDDRGRTVPKLTPALSRAIIDEAHRHRLRVVAHVFELGDAKDLLRAGVDGFAHLPRDRPADDELVGLLRARPDVVLTATLWSERLGIYGRRPAWLAEPMLREAFSEQEVRALADALARATDDELARSGATFAVEQQTLERLRRAGVRVAVGTDSGGVSGGPYFGWAAQIELESLVAAGFPPADAIVAGTRNSARLVGLERGGTIAPGKSADFLVLDADPLVDIRNTRRIADVYLRGDRIDREALRAGWQ